MSDNLAMTRVRDAVAAMYARDFAAYAKLLADDYRFEDRRSGLSESHGKSEELLQARAIVDLTDSYGTEPLESRGDRLILYRGVASAGEFIVTNLVITAIDETGLCVRAIVFDDGELGAARTELDRLYQDPDTLLSGS